jgi:hypothetical protein
MGVNCAIWRRTNGRDALPRDPALYVSTSNSFLPCESAHGPGDVCLFYLHWTCEPGSRGSASLPRAIAHHVRERIPPLDLGCRKR